MLTQIYAEVNNKKPPSAHLSLVFNISLINVDTHAEVNNKKTPSAHQNQRDRICPARGGTNLWPGRKSCFQLDHLGERFGLLESSFEELELLEG